MGCSAPMLSARGAVRCLRRCLQPEVVLESSSVGFGSRQRAWHRHPFFTEPFISLGVAPAPSHSERLEVCSQFERVLDVRRGHFQFISEFGVSGNQGLTLGAYDGLRVLKWRGFS